MKPRITIVSLGALVLLCAGFLYAQSQTQPSDWARDAWGWARGQGITDGTDPQGTCTREMVMTWLFRLEQRRSQGTLTLPVPNPPNGVQPGPVSAGETVYITKSGSKYHRAGCQYLSRSSIPISRSEAERRGYSPCSRCF